MQPTTPRTARTARLSLSIATLLLAALALPGAQAAPPPAPVDAADLEPGDVVAQGVPTPLGCHFDEPTRVRLDPAALGSPAGAHLDLATDEACRMVVQDVGPTNPLLDPFHDEGQSRSDNPDEDDSGGTVSTASSSKKVVTEVIHYGNGGKDDELTIKDQWIEFSWDGTEAWITDHSGTCWWVSGWVNDACVFDGAVERGDPVDRASHGDFHYDDGIIEAYYHTLEAYTYGYADGDHWCDYVWDGDIVNGVYMECYVP